MNVAVMGGILGFIGGILWAVALLIRRKVKQVPSIRPEPALAGGIMSLNENNKHNAEMRAREAELIAAEPIEKSNKRISRVATLFEGLAALATAGGGVATIVSLINGEMRWAPLTSNETSALSLRLSKIPPEPVTIGCATQYCKDLSESFSEAFRKAQWPDIKIVFSGGLGIDGITGLRLDPGDERTDAITSAIESATKLKIIPSQDPRHASYPPGVTFVIGTKPF